MVSVSACHQIGSGSSPTSVKDFYCHIISNPTDPAMCATVFQKIIIRFFFNEYFWKFQKKINH